MQCRHGGWDSVVHHHHIKVAGRQRGRNTDQVLGSKRITRRVRECLPIASEMSRDPTPLNNDCQETLNFQTDYSPGKNEIFIPPPHPKAFLIWMRFPFCCTSWKWVLVLRGEWKHTFWDWAGSSWQELTKPTQGQSSWLCWYGSWTGQHTPVPNSPWQHYGSHNGGPSVIYLHVFKFIARAHALDTNSELQRWCGQMWYI